MEAPNRSLIGGVKKNTALVAKDYRPQIDNSLGRQVECCWDHGKVCRLSSDSAFIPVVAAGL